MKKSSLAAIFFSLSLLTLALLCSIRVQAQADDRILSEINDDQLTQLRGNIHPLTMSSVDLGPVSDDFKLDKMMLLLSPSPKQQAELDQLALDQLNPKSPAFHQWLTPEEYGARFGLSDSDLHSITAWLQSHGFDIDEIAPNRRLILFTGSAANLANAFHTSLHQYQVRMPNGNVETHLANASNPKVPSAFAGIISGIVSLHDFRSIPAIAHMQKLGKITPDYSSGSTHYLAPADYATIYDLNALYSAGDTGTGQTIAIVARGNINLSDVSSFRSWAGLPTKQPTVTIVNTDPGVVSGDSDEAILDVEWSGAIAKAATINIVVASSTATTDGVDLSAQYIVNHTSGLVVSTSFGMCEQYMGSTENSFYNALWQQASTEGISAFVSSGDSGAAGCDGGSSSTGSQKGVNALCSSPYSTCVGGTEFNDSSNASQYWASSNGSTNGSALSYIPEMVWNESASNGGSGLWSSGGGVSQVYSQPSWQSGFTTGGAATSGMRGVPDIALTSASHDGYLVVDGGSMYVFGGTSASSPSFAGLIATIVQSKGGTGFGNINSTLYSMASSTPSAFHPTPTGSNTVPGVSGYTASGAIYNLGTGLGSVDGFNLASHWTSAGSGGGSGGGGGGSTADFTMSLSSSSASVLVGKTTSFTVSVAATGSTKPSVSLSAFATSGVNVSIKPSTIKPGTPATVTITVTSAATSGAQNIIFTGSDSSGSVTSTYVLTVVPLPTLTLTEAASSVSVVQGTSNTLSFNVATGGSFTGNVNLALSTLPTGVSASWSQNGIAATGTSSNTAVLTLTASTSAKVSTANITVTATGDGLSNKQSFSLSVLQAPGVSVVLSPSTVNMQSMNSASYTITATPLGGVVIPANAVGTSVSQTNSLPNGITGSWSSPTVSNGAVSWTYTLTGSVNATTTTTKPAFSVTITNSGTSNTYTGTASGTLNVTLTKQTLSISAASTSLTLAQSGSVTDVITLVGGGSYHGSTSLSVTGLPTGVTASWSANPVSISANTVTTTLTLTASSSASTKAANVSIVASGDSISAKTTVSVQVTKVSSKH